MFKGKAMSNGAIFAATSAATTAATAAAEEARKREEEEEMTGYTPEELNEEWEFKIVRANTPVFRKSERLRQVVEEEAHAGWTLLEKFDDTRVRFRRPRSAAQRDAYLPPEVDPYRTHIGASPNAALLVALGIGVALFLAGLLAVVLVAAAR
jgi:hypothetical protein